MNGSLALALVVDRDAHTREVIGRALELEGLRSVGASSSAEAAQLLQDAAFDLVVAEVGESGIEPPDLLRSRSDPERPPVFVALLARAEQARTTELIRAGAVDVLSKPVEEGRLRQVVQRARRQRMLLDELSGLREELRSRTGPGGLVGRSPALVALRERLERLAPGDSSVWFTGEAGSGRELAARTLHALSGRSGGPFVIVRREARDLPGLVQRASGGVLYLDDVSAMPADLLLRVRDILAMAAEFRVCCSSAESPAAATEHGRLPFELREQLCAETVQVPPLRERAEDIPLLARHFVRAVCSINFLPPLPIAPEALELLQSYGWPENVRELRNALEQAVIVSPDGTIRPRDLPDSIGRLARARESGVHSGPRRFRDAKRDVVDRFELAYLGELMHSHGGNVTAAALQAGMLRSALQRLLRKHGIKSVKFRQAGSLDIDDDLQSRI